MALGDIIPDWMLGVVLGCLITYMLRRRPSDAAADNLAVEEADAIRNLLLYLKSDNSLKEHRLVLDSGQEFHFTKVLEVGKAASRIKLKRTIMNNRIAYDLSTVGLFRHRSISFIESDNIPEKTGN